MSSTIEVINKKKRKREKNTKNHELAEEFIYNLSTYLHMAEEMSKEQQEMMEKIKKMSPEELLEFQKSRCIFCQINSGKVQSKKIYSDDKALGILDINPANPGHVLILPKEHYAIMPQIPEKVIEHLAVVTKRISQVSLQALGVGGTNILIQNGVAAGQKSQHFMVHVIPRKEGDGLNFAMDKKNISEADYQTVKSRLKKRVNEIFEIKEEEPKPTLQIQSTPMNAPAREEVVQPDKMEVNISQPQMIKEADIIRMDDGNAEPEQEEQTEEQVEENIEEEKEEFITSNKAKRYHTRLCPFAMNIPPEETIVLTQEDALNSGKKACTCVSGRKIPLPKRGRKELPPEEAKTFEKIDEANTAVEDINQDIEVLKEEIDEKSKEKKGSGINIDDIAKLFGGRR
jgi:histidine triad (HIT) family protein